MVVALRSDAFVCKGFTVCSTHDWPKGHYLTHLSSIIASWIGLPDYLRYAPAEWNATTHGNITFVVFLLASRYVCVTDRHSYTQPS